MAKVKFGSFFKKQTNESFFIDKTKFRLKKKNFCDSNAAPVIYDKLSLTMNESINPNADRSEQKDH